MTGARATRLSSPSTRDGAGAPAEDRPWRRALSSTVPMQGSGTFAVEAMLEHLRAAERQAAGPRQRRLWPAAKRRSRKIAGRASRRPRNAGGHAARSGGGRVPASRAPGDITHVSLVHCETTAGILNPIEVSAASCATHGRRLLIDAMSAFGALPLDCARDAVRRGRGVRQQMSRRRAGARLRRLPADGAGEMRGQCDDPQPRSL